MSDIRDTPVMFVRREASQIREMLAKPGTALLCPRCNEELTVSGPVSAGKTVGPVFHVVCTPCRRHAAIRDVPGDRVPTDSEES